MFRVSEQRGDSRVVLKLEGRFSSAFVGELDTCWRTVMEDRGDRSVWIDLTDVQLVDVAAQEQLTRMHRAGARFVTKGCLMRELVREIAECR
jgi:anti-anti-sigma regulatory factor